MTKDEIETLYNKHAKYQEEGMEISGWVEFANARLIAAAPELLEAAIELKDVCNRPSAARTRAEAWRKLDKAIAKALQPNWSLTHKESGEILGTVEK